MANLNGKYNQNKQDHKKETQNTESLDSGPRQTGTASKSSPRSIGSAYLYWAVFVHAQQ